ncbi:MAG: hypothetical protein WC554_09730 [Clostridia bacterium]
MNETVKLEVNGVYKTNVKDLVKIEEIREDKGQMYLHNITENCHQWVDIKKHRLTTKIR